MLIKNEVNHNGENGILVLGQEQPGKPNRIIRNTARFNADPDLYATPDCGIDRWRGNTFGGINNLCIR